MPVLSATQENGIVFRNDLDIDIKFDTHALSNYKVVSPGDYIISLRSFQGGFELSEKLGIISPAYTVFAFNNLEKNRQNCTFWKYLFKRYDFIESLKRLTFGIRDGKAISFTQFSTLKLSFPNFDEQNKIATLLHVLDRTITLHEEKKRQLERLKSALLQKMFADKSGYPKLRFNRFSNKWITINLGNMLIQSIQKNKGYSYPVFTSSRQGLVRQIEHFGSNQHHDTADYNVIFPNQITYRNRSDDGQFTFNVNKLGIVGLVSKFYPVFVLKDFDNDFVVNDLNNNAKIKYDLSVLSVGTGQHVLSFTSLCKYSIIAPDNHEQQKIGQLFSRLDIALSLCNMKIKRLKKLRHGLLQKMFV